MNLHGALDDRTAVNVLAISLARRQRGLSVDSALVFGMNGTRAMRFTARQWHCVAVAWRRLVRIWACASISNAKDHDRNVAVTARAQIGDRLSDIGR